ncbi:MAG: phage tail protein, partial [Fibrobacter sp.]|nr:phage tail protein [Fibrobacter sp.]
VRSWFGGKAGSLLDVYGGEWKYDNYTASLKQARGANRGVTIRYGKNLTQLSQVLDMSNLVTAIVPYYINPDGVQTVGTKVNTGLTLDVPREVAIDFSQEVDPESGTAITTQLANLANRYKNNNNLTTLTNSITLDFVQSGQLTERVDLCDTVSIYFEALGLTASAKCVATVWDVLAERYTSTTFGEARTNIADTIAQSAKKLAETPSTSFMSEAIAHATELITGNLGGYVILHDSNGDDFPDELLIMNTADISTATKVWRWNQNGLGYSSSGYAGPYGTAITADGKIVADYIATGTLDASKISVSHLSGSSIDTGTLNASLIKAGTLNCSLITVSNLSASSITTGTLDGTKATITNINASNINTGTLNADLIKAGTIEDVSHNSSINMANGKARLKNLEAKERFSLLDSGNVERVYITHTLADGATLHFNNNSNNDVIGIFTGTNGGYLRFNNNSTNERVRLFVGSADAGNLYLMDSSGTVTINASGGTGWITCVGLTQTSSRKVKENIKPIEDAAKILELDAVSFDYKNKAQGTDRRGFIAEDVAKVLPNLVTPETEDTPATLDYLEIIPYLQAVIKDQEKRIKALEDKLNERG